MQKSTEFGYSRKDVILIGGGLIGAGYALYYGLQVGAGCFWPRWLQVPAGALLLLPAPAGLDWCWTCDILMLTVLLRRRLPGGRCRTDLGLPAAFRPDAQGWASQDACHRPGAFNCCFHLPSAALQATGMEPGIAGNWAQVRRQRGAVGCCRRCCGGLALRALGRCSVVVGASLASLCLMASLCLLQLCSPIASPA